MAAVGITRTLEVMEELGTMAAIGVTLAKDFKGGTGLGAVLRNADKIMSLAAAMTELIADLPAALPELRDLDAQEAAQLSTATYAMVRKIIAAAA